MAKKLHSIRLHPDLWDWVDTYAKEVGTNRTAVIEALLQSLRDGRLWVVPRPNPFPGVRSSEVLPQKPHPQGDVPAGTYPHRFKEKADAS